MRKEKEWQIEKKISEIFEKKENAEEVNIQEIMELHNSEVELLKSNPSKLRVLYNFYEKRIYKMYRDEKNDMYLLYKSLWERTREFAVKNYNFNEISVFFNI